MYEFLSYVDIIIPYLFYMYILNQICTKTLMIKIPLYSQKYDALHHSSLNNLNYFRISVKISLSVMKNIVACIIYLVFLLNVFNITAVHNVS